MIPLLISAFVALTLIFEKLYYFKKVYALSRADFLTLEAKVKEAKFQPAAERSSLESALELTPVGSLFKVASNCFHLSSIELEKALSRRAQEWLPELEKRLEILDTIITAAPLMGLLGTITGMMASFQVLSTNGVNEPNAITGGVAEALIATATGLIVALVSLLFYNYFNAQVKGTLEAMELMANHILDQKTKQKPQA